MKRAALTGFILLAGLSRTPADMPPQQQVILTQGTSNSWTYEWSGVIERTYFSKWSTNLVDWNYLPDIEHGTGLKSSAFISSTPKFFVRLFYTDVPTVDSETADYDLDGLGNRDELNLGTDPLAADSDQDGVDDGVEVSGIGDPLDDADGDALRAVDTDGDGVSDAIELVNGTSPTLWDSDGDGFSDKDDVFPLDPTLHAHAGATIEDTTKPTVTLDAPANATFVSGP